MALGIVFILIGLFVGYWIGILRVRLQVPKIQEEAAKKATLGQGSAFGGQFSERMAPHLPGVAYNPAEIRFLGSPIDYVVFNGLNSEEGITEVVLLEVKTGKSKLSDKQKRIEDIVRTGKVRFEVYDPFKASEPATVA